WTLVSPASPPTNMAINSSTGQVTWTASFPFSPVNVTVQASGPGGTDTESWTITVTPPPIWVDFAYVGTQLGTSSQPFNTIAGAVSAASPGDVINVKGDSTRRYTLEASSITKQLRIQAVNGSIRIGGTLP